MIYEAKDTKPLIGSGPHVGELGRPIFNGTLMEWKGRAKAAWMVLRGNAVAVKWY